MRTLTEQAAAVKAREVSPGRAQLIGPAWSEQRLCGMGAAYQAATGWHLRPAPAS